MTEKNQLYILLSYTKLAMFKNTHDDLKTLCYFFIIYIANFWVIVKMIKGTGGHYNDCWIYYGTSYGGYTMVQVTVWSSL